MGPSVGYGCSPRQIIDPLTLPPAKQAPIWLLASVRGRMRIHSHFLPGSMRRVTIGRRRGEMACSDCASRSGWGTRRRASILPSSLQSSAAAILSVPTPTGDDEGLCQRGGRVPRWVAPVLGDPAGSLSDEQIAHVYRSDHEETGGKRRVSL